jgi:outer membrane lipoprotein carrier protein
MKTIFLMFISTYLFAVDFSAIKTFQAKFTQDIINPSGKVLKYDGDIFIARPNNILWKYKTPIIKNVYIKDQFAIIDEPELEQAIYTKIDQNIDLFEMINRSKMVSKDHYITTLNNVKYNIYTNKDKIKSISYTDNLENKVNILFYDAIYNKDLDQSIFKFKAPDGYDIIRK